MSASTPRPVAPADGARVEAGSITFRWEPLSGDAAGGSAAYGVQVAGGADFKDLLFDERVGTQPELTLSSLPRKTGVELYWRVRQQKASGAWGAFSEAAHFRIGGEGGDPSSAAAGAGEDPTHEDVTTRRREWSWLLGAVVLSILAVAATGYFLTRGVDFGGIDPAEAEAAADTSTVTEREAAEAARRLSTYELVEGEGGGRAYRIPIDRAMALIARDTAASGAAPFSDLVTDSTMAVPEAQ